MNASFPDHKEEYLTESEFAYPISINGKTKMNLSLSLSLAKDEVEREVLNADEVRKILAGQAVKKIIVVPGRIVNIVV
jgi:leucyl-tRNA synthetase